MKDKKVAITGATGLVGSHLAAELVRRGCTDITMPVRNTSRISNIYSTLEREGVDHSSVTFNVIETELSNPVELKRAFTGTDIVFNCAAAVSLGAQDEDVLIGGNVWIARHVVNACLEAGVDKLVHVSSIAALGDAPEGAECIDETMVPESISGMSAYGAGKFLCENEVVRGAVSGLQTVIVNPAVIIGEGDWRSGSTAMIPVLAQGLPYYPQGMTAVVDVRDVARAMVDLAGLEKAVGERFIIAAQNISYRELLTLSAHAAGNKPPKRKAGKHLLEAAWRIAAAWGALRGKAPAFSRQLAGILQNSACYNTEKIRNTINFEFTPVKKTVDRVVKRYLAEQESEK